MKTHQIVSLLLKFNGYQICFMANCICIENYGNESMQGKVIVLERMYFKKFQFLPSNDNSILKLALKVTNSLFLHMSSILI